MQILNSPVPTITNPLCLCSSWTPADLSLSGLYLCGHSAGAHLAAMVLSTDWSQYSITPQIKGKAHRVIEMSELGLILTHVETQMLHSWYPFFFFLLSLSLSSRSFPCQWHIWPPAHPVHLRQRAFEDDRVRSLLQYYNISGSAASIFDTFCSTFL